MSETDKPKRKWPSEADLYSLTPEEQALADEVELIPKSEIVRRVRGKRKIVGEKR